MIRGQVVKVQTLKETQRKPNNRGTTLGKHKRSWTVNIALGKHEKVGQSKHDTNRDKKMSNNQGVTLRKHKRGQIVEE